MIDFIAENVWIFVIVGIIIILVSIGYVVDKFVINKNPAPKKTDSQQYANMVPPTEPIDSVSINAVSSDNVVEQPLFNSVEEESVVVTEPLFDTENVNGKSVNVNNENSSETV